MRALKAFRLTRTLFVWRNAALPEFNLAQLVLPRHFPTGLSSEVVHRCPDTLAAEAQLHAAAVDAMHASAANYKQAVLVPFGQVAVHCKHSITTTSSSTRRRTPSMPLATTSI